MINLKARIEDLNLYINTEIRVGYLLVYLFRQEIVLYKALGTDDVVACSLKKQKRLTHECEDPNRMFKRFVLTDVEDFISSIHYTIKNSLGTKAFYINTNMDDIIANDTHLLMESVLFTSEGNIKVDIYYRQDEDCKTDEWKYYEVLNDQSNIRFRDIHNLAIGEEDCNKTYTRTIYDALSPSEITTLKNIYNKIINYLKSELNIDVNTGNFKRVTIYHNHILYTYGIAMPADEFDNAVMVAKEKGVEIYGYCQNTNDNSWRLCSIDKEGTPLFIDRKTERSDEWKIKYYIILKDRILEIFAGAYYIDESYINYKIDIEV